MKKKIKILIVEDEVMIAQWMKMELEDAGYSVYDFITTGKDAIEFMKDNLPDLILMDINLIGKLDGIDTAKIITSNIDIPIIFMTGYDKHSIVERAMKLNPIAYLTKPIEMWDLEPIIHKMFYK